MTANITVSCEAVPAPAEPTATDNSDPDPEVELDEEQIPGDCLMNERFVKIRP